MRLHGKLELEAAVKQPHIQDFVVMLAVPKQAAVGRREVATENLELGAAFTTRLRKMVESKGLEIEIAHVGEPMALPFITIEATDRVAEMIRKMPGVESVARDSSLIESLA